MSLPPSSPRLPSPPPPTEIQIGPKSPSLSSSGERENTIEQSILNANSARRIHPGTKAADMAAGPPLVALMELDSAFQLQEHLKALHHHHSRSSNVSHIIPISRSTASLIATPPNGVDRDLWLYELCRFLINKCNDLIVGFLFDSPPCSSITCPEMRASEWQFLCAVHESPKSCCAIDYCCHTLDWATNIVTSQKIFPSRLSLGDGDGIDGNGPGFKHLINIFRRLHRIFAHAWFQHRGVFWQVESQTGLYVLFKTVCDNYDLLPAENYKLPPEAEGLEPANEATLFPTILKPEAPFSRNTGNISEPKEDQSYMSVSRTNTRRHIRSSPSTGSAVTTVPEADFEGDIGEETERALNPESGDETDVLTLMKDMNISEKGSLQEEDIGVAQTSQEDEIQLDAVMDTEAKAETDIPFVVVSSKIDSPVEAEPKTAEIEYHIAHDAPVQQASAGNDSVDSILFNEEAVPELLLNPKESVVAQESMVHRLKVDHEEGLEQGEAVEEESEIQDGGDNNDA